METHVKLPPHRVMLKAFLQRDESFAGIFFTGVKTTGIFCRPGCPAKTPHSDHLQFFATSGEALNAGYRPCKRCRPLVSIGEAPDNLKQLIDAVLQEPDRRWTDDDIRAQGLRPATVRRWFKQNHGMTFHAYSRAVRVGTALGKLDAGDTTISAAMDSGFESLSGFTDAFKQITGTSPRKMDTQHVVTMHRIATPLGLVLAGSTKDAICLLEFCDRRMLATQLKTVARRFGSAVIPGRNELIAQLEYELSDYFRGDRKSFSVPLEFPGTDFQTDVWRSLLDIPYGETRSYQDLANVLENPGAVRAVARANGANRIAIIIPCHRVIGSDGSLTGYGGGLWRKQRLLELEKAIRSNQTSLFQ